MSRSDRSSRSNQPPNQLGDRKTECRALDTFSFPVAIEFSFELLDTFSFELLDTLRFLVVIEFSFLTAHHIQFSSACSIQFSVVHHITFSDRHRIKFSAVRHIQFTGAWCNQFPGAACNGARGLKINVLEPIVSGRMFLSPGIGIDQKEKIMQIKKPVAEVQKGDFIVKLGNREIGATVKNTGNVKNFTNIEGPRGGQYTLEAPMIAHNGNIDSYIMIETNKGQHVGPRNTFATIEIMEEY